MVLRGPGLGEGTGALGRERVLGASPGSDARLSRLLNSPLVRFPVKDDGGGELEITKPLAHSCCPVAFHGEP